MYLWNCNTTQIISCSLCFNHTFGTLILEHGPIFRSLVSYGTLSPLRLVCVVNTSVFKVYHYIGEYLSRVNDTIKLNSLPEKFLIIELIIKTCLTSFSFLSLLYIFTHVNMQELESKWVEYTTRSLPRLEE